jgi:hypothetical protein
MENRPHGPSQEVLDDKDKAEEALAPEKEALVLNTPKEQTNLNEGNEKQTAALEKAKELAVEFTRIEESVSRDVEEQREAVLSAGTDLTDQIHAYFRMQKEAGHPERAEMDSWLHTKSPQGAFRFSGRLRARKDTDPSIPDLDSAGELFSSIDFTPPESERSSSQRSHETFNIDFNRNTETTLSPYMVSYTDLDGVKWNFGEIANAYTWDVERKIEPQEDAAFNEYKNADPRYAQLRGIQDEFNAIPETYGISEAEGTSYMLVGGESMSLEAQMNEMAPATNFTIEDIYYSKFVGEHVFEAYSNMSLRMAELDSEMQPEETE